MVNSATIGADILRRRAERAEAARSGAAETAFLILDTESIPDGRLIGQVKYPGENLPPEEAIRRAQAEARELSRDGSDFLPVTFQVPVAVCVVRVAADFTLQALTCLDAPEYRPAEIVKKFWLGSSRYRAKLVTFNGRGFDLPLLELAAFRWGCCAREHFQASRNRYSGNHLDLFDWLSNYGACRMTGGLNLLAKLLGKPGKMEVDGEQVYAMHQAGRSREINEYCMFDTLDTYFVFLRTRVLIGDLTAEQERALEERAREWLTAKAAEQPALWSYLNAWQAPQPPALPEPIPTLVSPPRSADDPPQSP
jgi:predicted PolB exonuclease-like 3'-5' exonuclease